jgi:hypothetical protein
MSLDAKERIIRYHRVAFFLVVQHIPKIDQDSDADCNHSQDAVNLRTPRASHENAS